MSEKPVLRILPRWDPDEPRFVVEECEECSDDRAFKNNKCVFNQRLGFAYSVDEIVEVLNNKDVEDDFTQSECITVYDLKQEIKKLKKENEQLKQINRNLHDFRGFITEQEEYRNKKLKKLDELLVKYHLEFDELEKFIKIGLEAAYDHRVYLIMRD